MPVYIHQADLLDRFALVEGEKYVSGKGCTCFASDVGPPAAVKRWEEYQEYVSRWSGDDCREDDEPLPGGAIIYGVGGWTRYRVTCGGEVQFSTTHASDKSRKLAKEAGFTFY